MGGGGEVLGVVGVGVVMVVGSREREDAARRGKASSRKTVVVIVMVVGMVVWTGIVCLWCWIL